MRFLKVSLAILALAAPVASARAQEGGDELAAAPAAEATVAAPADQGWADTWALLFDLSLYNSLLGGFEGVGVGGQYYLGPNMAVRMTLGYAYRDNPRAVVERVDETAGSRVVTYALDPGTSDASVSSSHNLTVNADFLYRLTLSNVAPYAGGGLWARALRQNDNFEDDASVVNQVTKREYYYRDTAYGLRGLIGAEWRLHQSFALFAEYELGMTLARQRSSLTDTVTEVTIDGVRTVRHVSAKSSRKSGFDTDLHSGGNVGVAVNF